MRSAVLRRTRRAEGQEPASQGCSAPYGEHALDRHAGRHRPRSKWARAMTRRDHRQCHPAIRSGHEGLSGHRRAQARRFRRPCGRRQRAGRRERRRQVDADEDHRRRRAADARHIMIDGEDRCVSLNSGDAAAHGIGIVFQELNLFPQPVASPRISSSRARRPAPASTSTRANRPGDGRASFCTGSSTTSTPTRWSATCASASSRSSRSPRPGAGRPHPDHGRADLGAERLRGRDPVPRHRRSQGRAASPSSTSRIGWKS